jgi:hypothetical protein
MTDTKCEPPKPWANEWHWVEKDGKKACAYWWQTMENYWEWFGICPDGAGYSYLARVTTPAEVTEMRAKIARLEGDNEQLRATIRATRIAVGCSHE